MALIKDNLDNFLCSSNEAIEFRFIKRPEDLEDDSTIFKPDMSHQVFGENETIFGYRGLKIKLYYTPGRLSTYLGIEYDEKVVPEKFDSVKPDDIEAALKDKLTGGYYKNIDEFMKLLEADREFKPFGELIHTFENKSLDGTRKFEVYYTDVSYPGFISYHESLQPFVLWFIDGSIYIDVDDDRWRFFLIYEKVVEGDHKRYCIAGYCTVYQYYAYPSHLRPRISQFLILPPYQRQALGSELLKSIYRQFMGNSQVIDITVEEPSDDFSGLRDYVDCMNCMSLDSFQTDCLKQGFSNTMLEEAKEKFKLNKKQVRRVYEILRLKSTNIHSDEDYRAYRLDVKKRLNMPYMKEQFNLQRFQKMLCSNEYKSVEQALSKEQRLEKLERLYKELETYYLTVIDKIQNTALES